MPSSDHALRRVRTFPESRYARMRSCWVGVFLLINENAFRVALGDNTGRGTGKKGLAIVYGNKDYTKGVLCYLYFSLRGCHGHGL